MRCGSTGLTVVSVGSLTWSDSGSSISAGRPVCGIRQLASDPLVSGPGCTSTDGAQTTLRLPLRHHLDGPENDHEMTRFASHAHLPGATCLAGHDSRQCTRWRCTAISAFTQSLGSRADRFLAFRV
ncbi:unnamed protein product [Protopolystoma xenopodis]|uniref:Uncharacterized protein n=1 Tax=Protopolystoma xenopodis TaxID=117903 RepID=A0A3S5ARW5_9PLAT|nr:unnamed protein product [Protopolystoma xenopodis]